MNVRSRRKKVRSVVGRCGSPRGAGLGSQEGRRVPWPRPHPGPRPWPHPKPVPDPVPEPGPVSVSEAVMVAAPVCGDVLRRQPDGHRPPTPWNSGQEHRKSGPGGAGASGPEGPDGEWTFQLSKRIHLTKIHLDRHAFPLYCHLVIRLLLFTSNQTLQYRVTVRPPVVTRDVLGASRVFPDVVYAEGPVWTIFVVVGVW